MKGKIVYIIKYIDNVVLIKKIVVLISSPIFRRSVTIFGNIKIQKFSTQFSLLNDIYEEVLLSYFYIVFLFGQ